MEAVAWIAEQKIREAIAAGELDDIPGMGRPLSLEADAGRSEHWLANKILRNAGVLPYPMQLRKEIEALQSDIRHLLCRARRRLHEVEQRIASAEQELVAGGWIPSVERARVAGLPEQNETLRAKGHLTKKQRKKTARIAQGLRRCAALHYRLRTEYRALYLHKLSVLNAKIDALMYHQTKEEIQRRKISQAMLAPAKANVPKLAQRFDAEFPRYPGFEQFTATVKK